MSKPFRLSLIVRLFTPLSSGAVGTVGPVLADKVVVRNGLGEYIIPASQVKGVLRHACERLLRAMGRKVCSGPRPELMCPQSENLDIPKSPDPFNPGHEVSRCALCEIFGSPYFPSLLQFHDLLCENPFRQKDEQLYATPREARLGTETIRSMVSINRYRRVAEPQRLFFIETTPAQPQVSFENAEAIIGVLASEAQAKLLLAGLKTVLALGGGRSRGLGWVEIESIAWLDGQQITPSDWKALSDL